MKNNLIKLDTPELKEIDKSKSDKIRDTFEPMAKMLSEFEAKYSELMSIPVEEMTPELTKEYKRLRLDIGQVRINTGKAKDKAKEYLKLEDKAIMGVHNILVWAVKEKEDNLKDRENYFETLEKKRLEALQLERAEELSLYVEDAHERDLAKFADDEFEALLAMKRKEQEDRIEAERRAEEDRIAKELAEKEERERIEKENLKLKAEAEALAKLARQKEIERERELEQIAIESARAKAEYESKLKKELEDREKSEAEALAKQRKLEAELQAKKDAEDKAVAEAEAIMQSELNKGDEDKVTDLIGDFKSLKTKYTFKSDKNKKMYSDVSTLIDKVISHIGGK